MDGTSEGCSVFSLSGIRQKDPGDLFKVTGMQL